MRALRPIDVVRPVRTAYRLRALVRSVAEALGKFPTVNIASAGSPVAIPSVIVGTSCRLYSHTFARVTPPPMLSACDPLIQFTVSSTTRVPPSRELFALAGLGSLTPLTPCQPVAGLVPTDSEYPFMSPVDCPEYIDVLRSGENSVAPPVAP